MTELARYILTCAALAGLTAGGIVPFLPEDARLGLWVAGGSAWGIQAIAAAARVRWGGRPERLLAVWGWSSGGRLAAVGLAALAVYRFDALHAVTTLVGLAGYLFVMLLMEPILLRIDSPAQTETR